MDITPESNLDGLVIREIEYKVPNKLSPRHQQFSFQEIKKRNAEKLTLAQKDLIEAMCIEYESTGRDGQACRQFDRFQVLLEEETIAFAMQYINNMSDFQFRGIVQFLSKMSNKQRHEVLTDQVEPYLSRGQKQKLEEWRYNWELNEKEMKEFEKTIEKIISSPKNVDGDGDGADEIISSTTNDGIKNDGIISSLENGFTGDDSINNGLI